MSATQVPLSLYEQYVEIRKDSESSKRGWETRRKNQARREARSEAGKRGYLHTLERRLRDASDKLQEASQRGQSTSKLEQQYFIAEQELERYVRNNDLEGERTRARARPHETTNVEHYARQGLRDLYDDLSLTLQTHKESTLEANANAMRVKQAQQRLQQVHPNHRDYDRLKADVRQAAKYMQDMKGVREWATSRNRDLKYQIERVRDSGLLQTPQELARERVLIAYFEGPEALEARNKEREEVFRFIMDRDNRTPDEKALARDYLQTGVRSETPAERARRAQYRMVFDTDDHPTDLGGRATRDVLARRFNIPRDEVLSPEEVQTLRERIRTKRRQSAEATRRAQEMSKPPDPDSLTGTGHKVVRRFSESSIGQLVLNLIDPTQETIENVFETAVAGKRTRKVETDTSDYENALYTAARRLAKSAFPDLPEEKIDELVSYIASGAGERMVRSSNVDAKNSRMVISQMLRSGEITEHKAKILAKLYTGLTAQQIRAAENMRAHLARQGMGKREQDRLVKAQVERWKAQRSMSISNYELSFATNMMQQLAWEEKVKEGVMDSNQKKRWNAVIDAQTCNECEQMDGTEVTVLEDWVTDTRHGTLRHPPMHSMCRCLIELVD